MAHSKAGALHRHLASSGVDVYTAVAGGVGALYGPLHGGANEAVLRMLERIGSVDAIPDFLEGVKNRKEKLFGFGHRCEAGECPRRQYCFSSCLAPASGTHGSTRLFCSHVDNKLLLPQWFEFP